MTAHRIVGWLLVIFAALLSYSQTIALPHLMGAGIEGFDFSKRYAIESSIESYGLALVALSAGVFAIRSSGRAAACSAFAVSLIAFWLMVGREVWLHYFVLPSKYPSYSDSHPYFHGTYWMFTARFCWHLILPVTMVLAALNVLQKTRKPAVVSANSIS